MAQIFISYSSADRERARRLAEALQAQGYAVWWDRQIAAGQTFDEVIEKALDTATCVVVLWSSTSVKSDWVKTEASEAASRKIMVPALLDKVKIPLEFRRVQTADLTAWDGTAEDKEFQRFLQAINLELYGTAERPSSPATAGHDSPSVAPAAASPVISPPPMDAIAPSRRSETSAADQAAASTYRHLPQGSASKRVAFAAVPVLIIIAGGLLWFARPTRVHTPDVVGMPYENAAAALAAVGLEPERTERPSDTDAPGTIVVQSPPAGETLARSAKVVLTVAVPAPAPAPVAEAKPASIVATPEEPPAVPSPPVVSMVAIPNLRGQTPERALELLAEAGLTSGVKHEGADNEVSLGTIMAQDPAASQTVAKGSPVQVTVAVRRTIPELTGLALDEAQQALARLGLTARLERVQAGRGERDNRVVKQTPVPGTAIEGGGQAILTVATVAPKRVPGGEPLFRTNGQRCNQLCKDIGLTWKGVWSGNNNSCTCEF